MKTGRVISIMLVSFLLFFNSAQADLRKAERLITKNGLTVVLLERNALPFITVHTAIKAGSYYDPREYPGLANITAHLLTEGTSDKSASEISEKIDFVGGSLSSGGGIDYSSASLTVLSKDRETGFELLSDILINPSFAEEEIERAKSQIKAGIISKADDPSTVATEAFNKILFGKHPYSRPAEGDIQSVEKIEREDIVSFHNKFYRPNNTIMAVVGDINRKELVRLLNKYFGKWEEKRTEFSVAKEPGPAGSKRIKIIDKNITQANVEIGGIGMSRDNPDFYAAYVMNYILGGGGFVSRLVTEIRDNMGLVYSVYSYFNPLKDKGPFKVGLQTKNSSAVQAINEVIRQLKNIKDNGISEKELQDAKDHLIGSFPLKFTTNKKIASYLTYIEIHNLGLDYMERFPKIISDLTVDDINMAAGKYLDPENYLLVVVGNKEKIGDLEKSLDGK